MDGREGTMQHTEQGGRLADRAVAVADRGLAGVVAAEPAVRFVAGGARYGVAAIASAAVYPVLSVLLYVGFLVWATVTDRPTGGPFGILGLLGVGVVVGVACTVLALAVCAVAEVATVRAPARRAVAVACSLVVHGAVVAALAAGPLQHTDGWELPVAGTVAIALAAAAPAVVVVLVVVHTGGALTGLVLRAARRRVDRTAAGRAEVDPH